MGNNPMIKQGQKPKQRHKAKQRHIEKTQLPMQGIKQKEFMTLLH